MRFRVTKSKKVFTFYLEVMAYDQHYSDFCVTSMRQKCIFQRHALQLMKLYVDVSPFFRIATLFTAANKQTIN